MMTGASLNLSGEGFGRSAAGVVYAELSLHVGELKFPHPQWSDFVVVVLTWWCDALRRLLEGEHGPIKVSFMEGPYSAEIGPVEQNLVHLVLARDVFVKNQVRRDICLETDVNTRALIRSVLSAAERTLRECTTRGWWSSDADKLRAARDSLRQLFQEH
jgi:hypothetical protein